MLDLILTLNHIATSNGISMQTTSFANIIELSFRKYDNDIGNVSTETMLFNVIPT